ncbi:hypothetical protein, partial [Tropicimonas sp. IMCC6043]|uniref:hypothetical protein n=1 Tax=Tropicimonas sp. IMCC6043 TaxID=2510645 RepID=UPI001A925B7C
MLDILAVEHCPTNVFWRPHIHGTNDDVGFKNHQANKAQFKKSAIFPEMRSPLGVCKVFRIKLGSYAQNPKPRCLIPRFDGAIHSLEWKEALWDRYVTAAPRPRTPSEQQYS